MDCTNRYSDLNNGFIFESYFYSKLMRFRDYSANISSLGNIEIWAKDVYVQKINILKGTNGCLQRARTAGRTVRDVLWKVAFIFYGKSELI